MEEKVKSKKSLILETAAALFIAKGYNASSLREIAMRVNVEVSSIYSHFTNKEALLKEICFENAEAFLNGIGNIDPDSPVDVQIGEIVSLHVRMISDKSGAVLLFSEEWKNLSGDNLSRFKKMRKLYENEIISRLGRNHCTKEEQDIVMRFFLSGMQWLYKGGKKWSGADKKLIASTLLSLYTKGIP